MSTDPANEVANFKATKESVADIERPRTYLLELWRFVPSRNDEERGKQDQAKHEAELLKIFDDFIRICENGSIRASFEKQRDSPPKDRGPSYPWHGPYNGAGLAWYIVFAEAALELQTFLPQLDGSAEERMPQVIERVKATLNDLDRNAWVDKAFQQAKGIAHWQSSVEPK